MLRQVKAAVLLCTRPSAGVWAALLWSGVLGAAPLPDFDVRYQLHLDGFKVGEAHYQLSRQDDHFLYQSRTQPTGIAAWFRKDQVQEHSTWTLQNARIQPLRYHYQRTGGKKERFAELTFDWQSGQVENLVEGQPWQMDIPVGTLDKMVVTLALMLDLRQGKREVEYAIADGGKLKTYRFRVVAEERVETNIGSFDALKLERIRKDNKRYTALWCAPALHYLPIRIKQREKDGHWLSSELQSVSEALRVGVGTSSEVTP